MIRHRRCDLPKLKFSEEELLARVASALRKHDGCISKAAKEAGISTVTLFRRLGEWGWSACAANLRAAALIKGSRAGAETDPANRKEVMVRALEKHGWNHQLAMEEVGMARRTWFREFQRLEIKTLAPSDDEVRSKLIEALEAEEGVVLRAAKRMGKSHTTLQRWCARFEVDPSKYRRD